MKKVIILVFCWVAVHSCVIAQGFQFVYGTKEIAPGLILSATSDGYSIDYTLPEFNEVVVHTECGTFSTICFVGDDDFSEMDSTGMPALPIKSVNLQIPSSDSSVTYHVFPPTHTGYSIYDPYTYIQLQHPYCPAMEMLEDSSAVCKMNEGFYYSDTWYSCDVTNNVFVSERYRYLGCVGVSVNLFPVEYNPKQKLVRIPKRIRLNIDVPLQSLNAELQFKYNPVTFFDSWWSFCVPDTISGGSGKKGRLLIVTLPEFEQALIEYCRYKDATGYIVDIQADENFRQSVKVRNLLMNAYHSNSRPDFVLIVGSPLLIPYSDGIRDKYNNPLTDIYYACLEKSNISKEPMSPDVCVGRWPVSSVTDIYNIALKTIIFEQEIVNYQKSVSLFSGIGKGQNLFFSNIQKIAIDLSSRLDYIYPHDGRTFFNMQAAVNAMKSALQNNVWMFVYRGHGWYVNFSAPYNFDIEDCPVSTICPITFSIACLTNAMEMNGGELQPSLGMCWLKNSYNRGGVAFLGATALSDRFENNYMDKKIFKRLGKIGINDNCVGNLIYNGMMDYYSSCKVSIRRHQVEKYVLMGDPSVLMNGMNFTVSQENMSHIATARSVYEQLLNVNVGPLNYTQKKAIPDNGIRLSSISQSQTIDVIPTITDDNIWIYFSENVVADIKVLSLSGAVLHTQQNVVSGASLSMSSLSDGMYIVFVQTSDGQSGNYKVIVKH